jgi:hypothetical protein
MHKYVARRLLMLIPMLIGVSLVVFVIMRLRRHRLDHPDGAHRREWRRPQSSGGIAA